MQFQSLKASSALKKMNKKLYRNLKQSYNSFIVNQQEMKIMQGTNDSFQKMQKKNRKFDDGLSKQGNSKKFKQKRHIKEYAENY